MMLRDKTAVITGAGSGFGAEISHVFSREGARVIIADIDEAAAQRVAGEIGEMAIAIKCDVARRDDIDRMISETVSKFSIPDIVVNNAGVIYSNRFILQTDEAVFDRIFSVNVKAVYHMMQAVIPQMRINNGGSIINISSTGGIRPRPGLTLYNASKGAVVTLSKSLAVELAPDGIRVNAICPALAETNMLRDAIGAEDTLEARARFISSIPLGRLGRASDVANAALFLAKDSSNFLTGLDLAVDGGRCV